MQILGNRCLVEFVPETNGHSLIALPESLQPRSTEAVIRQVGTQRRGDFRVTHAGYLLSELAVGQRVKINPQCGTLPIKVGDEELHMISTLDVLAILE